MLSPSVSVIIPCFNAERHIRRCLEGVERQTYPDFEVVAVDDASTDGTLGTLKEFQAVKIVRNSGNRGPAFSRNRGIEASSGHLLVFLDADCAVEDPEWLSRHVRAHDTLCGTILGGGILGVGKGVVARADSYCHWLTNIPYSKERIASRSARQGRVHFSRHLVTTNMSLPRPVFLAVGAFDEGLRTGEDVEFCERAIARGFTLRLESEIVVRHHDRESLREFARCFYRVGLDRVPARRRHFSRYHHLMPRGVLSSILLCIPIGLLGPLQPITAWIRYDARVVLYYPLIAVSSFAMALGIVRYWVDQRRLGG